MPFGKAGKEKEPVNQQELHPILPFDLQSELSLCLVLTRTIKTLLSDARGYSVQELSAFLESHPGFSAWILERAMSLISSEIDKDHVELIVSALLENRQVVVMGPHYSVADMAGFLVVLKKVQEYSKQKKLGIQPTIMGPASSKFFHHKQTMFAKVLVEPLQKMGIDLFQVAQVQDKETRETLTESEIQSINTKAWMQILRGMKKGKMLGIFQNGTRETSAGVTRAPIEVCNALAKILKSDALVVPVITEGSDLFLGKGMPEPNFAHLPTVITSHPISYGEMEKLAVVLNTHLVEDVRPIHPVEIANLLAVVDKPHRWGELTPFITLLLSPSPTLLEDLETVLPTVKNHENI